MQLTEAFRSGQPARVWELSQQLVKVARSAADEAAQARFKGNLGTKTCDNCEGLKAGVGVTATQTVSGAPSMGAASCAALAV